MLAALAGPGCKYGEKTMGKGPYSVVVSWNANREAAVNSTGGGYRVYYSIDPNFRAEVTSSVDVPYVSGAEAPTSVTIRGLTYRAPYRYHVRVLAYSALTNLSGELATSAVAETSVSAP